MRFHLACAREFFKSFLFVSHLILHQLSHEIGDVPQIVKIGWGWLRQIGSFHRGFQG
jgi:hypothetical protein